MTSGWILMVIGVGGVTIPGQVVGAGGCWSVTTYSFSILATLM